MCSLLALYGIGIDHPLRMCNLTGVLAVLNKFIRRGEVITWHTHYLREWREARGLTLGQMSARIPFHKSTLSRIEAGLRQYNQAILEAYAVVLGCQPGALISRPPGGPEELWTILGDCDEQELTRITAMTKILLEDKITS
jgi:transcriptional regulator with XRE-family HTH domain